MPTFDSIKADLDALKALHPDGSLSTIIDILIVVAAAVFGGDKQPSSAPVAPDSPAQGTPPNGI